MKVIFFEMADQDKSGDNEARRKQRRALRERRSDPGTTPARFTTRKSSAPRSTLSLAVGLLDQFTHLKLIAARSTGFDQIDLDYCRKRGVGVCNAPVYGELTVAEHAFALLLALARHVVDSVEATRSGDFSLNFASSESSLRSAAAGLPAAVRDPSKTASIMAPDARRKKCRLNYPT